MNQAILFLAAFAILVLCIESRRPANCRGGCDTARCPSLYNCKCGTYFADGCDCCQSCRKCAGEQCYIADREMCSEGHECRQEDGLRGSDRPGTCVEIYHRNSRPHGSMTVVNRPVSCREECASARCAPVDHCRCGTVFHDRCKCCPSCQKCPGEQCNIATSEMCPEGYHCKQWEVRRSDRSNNHGTCVRTDHTDEYRSHETLAVVDGPVNCRRECDAARCAPIDNCQCGTYFADRDRCKCCRSCRRCPREQCSIVAREMCAEGYQCKQEQGLRGPDRFNKSGICLETESFQHQSPISRNWNGTRTQAKQKVLLTLEFGDKRH